MSGPMDKIYQLRVKANNFELKVIQVNLKHYDQRLKPKFIYSTKYRNGSTKGVDLM